MMFEFAQWFFNLIRPPVKECVDCRLKEEVVELRKLVDSLCARTNDLPEANTIEWRAQMTLMSKSHMHGHRLVREKAARMELDDLELKRLMLLQDHPQLREQ